jgi:hypothetical protein
MATNHEIPWLVMVYMAGDNSLSEDMVLALQDLTAEGPPEGDRIVAQFDPAGVGLSSQRYQFGDDELPNPNAEGLERHRVLDYNPPESNTGDREDFVSFVKWAIDAYSDADTKYLLILSGHGSGITDDFFLTDSEAADSLTIQELGQGLRDIVTHIRHKNGDGKKIDVLGLDACCMAMGEIAYEIRDQVGILVAAEGLEPEFGWPYRRILRAAQRKAGQQPMAPEPLARMIVKQYIDHYADYDRSAGRSADLAAIELTKMEGVVKAVRALVTALPKDTEKDRALHERVLLAHWFAQTYKFDQFVDLKDLCEQLKKKCPDIPNLPDACEAVITAVEGAVIRSECSGFAHQYSYGLSVYFPWAVVSPDYGVDVGTDPGHATVRPKFAQDTEWHTFLKAHVEATRREARYPQVTAGDSLDAVVTARANRIRQGVQDPLDGTVRNRINALEKQRDRVRNPDILPADRPRELGRRLIRVRGIDPEGRSRLSQHTRLSEHTRLSVHTRLSEHTRSLDDRERWVKNLPPAIGRDSWGRKPCVEAPEEQLVTS